MNLEKNKNLWISLAAGVVIVVVIMFLARNKASAPIVGDNSEVTDLALSPNIGIGNISTPSSPLPVLTYLEALKKYKDARLQLDNICQTSPIRMVFKNGAYLMVDNRAPVTRTVKIGSVFSVKAYDFKIIRLSSEILPVTWLVDCDQSENVATIVIQK